MASSKGRSTTTGALPSRRQLLGATACTLALAQIGCTSDSHQERSDTAAGTHDDTSGSGAGGQVRHIFGSCSPDCQNHLLEGIVEDGRLVDVVGANCNESKPCARGLARVDMCTSPERLTTPLLRHGEKGSGDFEAISWDEAFDLIEKRLREAIDARGAGSVLAICGSGNFGALTNANPMGVLLDWLGGGRRMASTLCCAGAYAAIVPMFGKRFLSTRDWIEQSDYVITWGNDPSVTMASYFDRFVRMVDTGGTLCTIDPLFTHTAAVSQEWLQPWPGSDAALALAMIRIVIEEGLVDEAFLLEHTTAPRLIDRSSGLPLADDSGCDSLCLTEAGDVVPLTSAGGSPTASSQLESQTSSANAPLLATTVTPLLSTVGTPYEDELATEYDLVVEQAMSWGREEVEAECGVSYDDVRRVALGYARAKRAMIVQNMGGFMRTQWGTYAVATQLYLALFCGHVGHVGDGICDAGGAAGLLGVGPAYPANPDARPPEPIPFPHFGDWVLREHPGELAMAWISCANPAAQMPNSPCVRQALADIPFVVTVDQFMTSTCLWSDLVLPCTAVFETPNVSITNRSVIVQLSEAGVTPPGQAKTDLAIVAEVARRMGVEGVFDQPFEAYARRVLEPTGIAYEDLLERKGIDARELVGGAGNAVPYEGGVFPTDDGRARLWVREWLDEGYWPIARHLRPDESVLRAGAYPLGAVQKKTHGQVNSSFAGLSTIRSLEGSRPRITLNADDASARGITSGDAVTAYNDRGEHEGIAYVTRLVKRGVVVLQDGWDEASGATPSSCVTSDLWPTLGSVHCCNSTLVEVRKREDG